VIYTQKQPGCKKRCGPAKNDQCEKAMKSKGAAKKWLWWYRLVTKILITTIQVNLCCLILAPLGISTKFTWIVVIKIFAINLYHHRHFLAAPFDFTTFFTLVIFNRAAPFFTARLFLSRYLLHFDNLNIQLYAQAKFQLYILKTF